MGLLEDLKPGAVVRGITPVNLVTVDFVKQCGPSAITLFYTNSAGDSGKKILYRSDESSFEIVNEGISWNFLGDPHFFRLTSEARRIQMAYLFDPLLAVNSSLVEPLPHQITAVYEVMIPRQPLRFLLADDPGAGKTIMAGLLIKELMARGDLNRCLIVCPGNLIEQWQDELHQRFHIFFELMTNDKIESCVTGNWLAENNLAICRLDKLARNEDIQKKLESTDWDLIICDEAHKMSASYYGGEIKKNKRYRLGEILSRITRNFLLMTATPHNGKEIDFQLFMRLIDGDRFEGKFRDGAHVSDTSDLMRRLLKEELLKFDGKPLFPERIAYTINYDLSKGESLLYKKVTEYVKEEFNRADSLGNQGRRGTVGFALTILQRRLASSPEAIYQSIRRRKIRLEARLNEEQINQRASSVEFNKNVLSDLEDLEELDDVPDEELENIEDTIVDRASASITIEELKAEIETLKELEKIAVQVRESGNDHKWEQLSSLLKNNPAMFDSEGSRRKLIIFTEHKDTLYYLEKKIKIILNSSENVVTIHGGMGREQRKLSEHRFTHDKDVMVLIATDAAGEGINLQRAHLMVNYDLPWNPNRLEQRFGRIHRIGQKEVCHLWNLVASETREGAVYKRLLEKIEEERKSLGGRVFDVLGKITYDNHPLRELLIEAIRYGDQPEVKARLNIAIDGAFDRQKIRDLIEDRALVSDAIDLSKVQKIREQMERAEARRLQPHFISSFFNAAFTQLGGKIQEREPQRYEITHVPAIIRNRDRIIGKREPLLTRYERITFEKSRVQIPEKPTIAAFVCPGHPLLDTVIDLTIEQHHDLLKQGTIFIDDNDPSENVRALLMLEHSIQDETKVGFKQNRVVSKRIQFVEIFENGDIRNAGYAPYLNFRPASENEKPYLKDIGIPKWISKSIEDTAQMYTITHLIPEHLSEVKSIKEPLIDKTKEAVLDRLTKEINYCNHRAREIREKELTGKASKMNSAFYQKQAEDLSARLEKRMKELEYERSLSPLPPIIIGGAIIIPMGLLQKIGGKIEQPNIFARETKRIETLAMKAVFKKEIEIGYEPQDVSKQNVGYDIESRIPGTGMLRFIEVKGRIKGATTVTVTKNEIITALNKPENFILALVEVDGEETCINYITNPFKKEPDFSATSVNYNIGDLLESAISM